MPADQIQPRSAVVGFSRRPPDVRLGTGEAAFRLLQDDDNLPGVHGRQGASGPRVRGEDEDWRSCFRVHLSSTSRRAPRVRWTRYRSLVSARGHPVNHVPSQMRAATRIASAIESGSAVPLPAMSNAVP